MLTLIVARSRNGVIGRDNALPFRVPEDVRYFKSTTLGHPVVMGRRTFDSIGKPLPGRLNIVITRSPRWSHPGCERASSLAEAIGIAEGRQPGVEIFVIGGAQIYREALPIADRAIVTEVDAQVEGDTFFPDLPAAQWQAHPGERQRSSGGLDFSIVDYRRIAPAASP